MHPGYPTFGTLMFSALCFRLVAGREFAGDRKETGAVAATAPEFKRSAYWRTAGVSMPSPEPRQVT